MDERLQACLDGELSRDDLPADLRREAERWNRLVDRMRAHGPEGVPAGLERRVMSALPAHPERAWWREAWEWLVRPRTIRLSPLAGATAAAAIAFLLLIPSLFLTDRVEIPGEARTATSGGRSAARTAAVSGRVYVQFSLPAPQANSVAVAGDFTDWEPVYYLDDVDGDGVWTGRVPLGPGVHEYMFVVDGEKWVTDPGAERYVDDGFGHRNAVVAISDARI